MNSNPNRANWLLGTAAIAGAATVTIPSLAEAAVDDKEPFGYCLNTSTIREQKIPLDKKAEIAAKAGYSGFEPWLGELADFVKQGGVLKDLGKKLADPGFASAHAAIEFRLKSGSVADADAETRHRGLSRQRWQTRIWKPLSRPIGGMVHRRPARRRHTNEKAVTDLYAIADRYRALAEVGKKIGIIPEVELWGFSKTRWVGWAKLSSSRCEKLLIRTPASCRTSIIFTRVARTSRASACSAASRSAFST